MPREPRDERAVALTVVPLKRKRQQVRTPVRITAPLRLERAWWRRLFDFLLRRPA